MSSSAVTFPSYLDPTKAADGSAAAPSFAFANSTSTGIYRVSANTLGISTAGVQRVVVDSNGITTTGYNKAFASTNLYTEVGTGYIEVCNSTTTPFIDFKNLASEDFDVRLAANGADLIVNCSKLLVGTNNSVDGETVSLPGTTAIRGVGIKFIGSTIIGTGNAMGLRWSGPDIMGTVDNVTYAVLGTVSDYRLKTDFQELQTSLSKVLQLKPLTYAVKDFDGTIKDERRTGFIAHEIQEVFPDLATLRKDAKDEQGNPQYQSVNYAGLTPYLVKAIQEQQAQIEEMKAKLAALEAKP